MAKKLAPITEQYQRFVRPERELLGWTCIEEQALKQVLEAESDREWHLQVFLPVTNDYL